MSVTECCQWFGFSRQRLYQLWRDGRGPEYVVQDGRRMVSEEAAREWRDRMARPLSPAEADGLRAAAQAQESAGMAEMVEQRLAVLLQALGMGENAGEEVNCG